MFLHDEQEQKYSISLCCFLGSGTINSTNQFPFFVDGALCAFCAASFVLNCQKPVITYKKIWRCDSGEVLNIYSTVILFFFNSVPKVYGRETDLEHHTSTVLNSGPWGAFQHIFVSHRGKKKYWVLLKIFTRHGWLWSAEHPTHPLVHSLSMHHPLNLTAVVIAALNS